MPKILDLIGQRFGRLIVTAFHGLQTVGTQGHRVSAWRCLCVCGTTVTVVSGNLKGQHPVKSCGCWRREFPRANKTHGQRKTRTYGIWNAMRQRCSNPNTIQFADYGGRGITVCERWGKFENFLADMGEAPEGKSIERIDNNAGYAPENCKWATREEQGRNTRHNRLIEYNGRTQTATDWAKETGIPMYRITERLDVLNWPVHRALTTPPRAGKYSR